jgi:hypothetical protein
MAGPHLPVSGLAESAREGGDRYLRHRRRGARNRRPAGTARRPQAHEAGEPRYWLTFWLSDGTTLSRVYFRETHELMGGVVVSGDFTRIIERYLCE